MVIMEREGDGVARRLQPSVQSTGGRPKSGSSPRDAWKPKTERLAGAGQQQRRWR
jgi:hypothetical protein